MYMQDIPLQVSPLGALYIYWLIYFSQQLYEVLLLFPFKDGETKAQRDEVTCSESHSTERWNNLHRGHAATLRQSRGLNLDQSLAFHICTNHIVLVCTLWAWKSVCLFVLHLGAGGGAGIQEAFRHFLELSVIHLHYVCSFPEAHREQVKLTSLRNFDNWFIIAAYPPVLGIPTYLWQVPDGKCQWKLNSFCSEWFLTCPR